MTAYAAYNVCCKRQEKERAQEERFFVVPVWKTGGTWQIPGAYT